MGSQSITFRGESIHLHDTSLAIWLRLMAMNLEVRSSEESVMEMRNDWMSDSAWIGFCAPSLDKIDASEKNAEVVLIVAARLVYQIERAGRRFEGAFLNLLGLAHASWQDDARIDASDVLHVADRFVRLVSKHDDIVQSIIRRHTSGRCREGPPCPYCGVRLWHESGLMCLDCGWDWHDAENPVQRKTGSGQPEKPIACLQDGGNPFDDRGWLRRVEMVADV